MVNRLPQIAKETSARSKTPKSPTAKSPFLRREERGWKEIRRSGERGTPGSVILFAGVLGSGDKAQLGREFEVSGQRIDRIPEMFRIRLPVGAFVGGEGEGDEFENAKAQPGNGLAGAFNHS